MTRMRSLLSVTCVRHSLLAIAWVVLTSTSLRAQRIIASADESPSDVARTEALLSRLVTINLKGVTRDRLVDAAAQSAKVLVQYRTPLFDAYQDAITLRVTNIPLGVALERILAGTNLRVVSDHGKRLAIVDARDVAASLRDSVPTLGVVSGTVVDSASGHEMSGAVIQLSGTDRKTSSNKDGRWTFRAVPAGEHVLTVRLLGYTAVSQTVIVAANQTVDVKTRLGTRVNMLSGVVTTATGVQQKLSVGTDITTLNVDSILRVAPVRSVTDLLETRVPGMTVIRSSGVPGAPSRVRLRGTSSVTGNNDPIVIVDGIRIYAVQSDPRNSNGGPTNSSTDANIVQQFAAPSPLDQIDPNSIEKIDVLKGPSASSLYGSDAANGVIVITTKRARGGRAHWNVAFDQGLEYSPGKYPDVVTQFGSTIFNGESELCPLQYPCITYDSTTRFQTLNSSRFTRLGRGSSTGAAATVTGGTEALTYSFTGSAGRRTGLLKLPENQRELFNIIHHFAAPKWALKPDALSTWGGSGSVVATPAPVLQLTVNANVFSSTQHQTSLDAGAGAGYVDTTVARLGSYYRKADTDLLTMRGGLSARWTPTPWLPLEGTLGLDVKTSHTEQFLPRGYHVGIDSIGAYSVGNGTSQVRTASVQTRVPLYGDRLESAVGFNYHDESLTDVSSAVFGVPAGSVPPTDLRPLNSRGYGTQSSVGTSTFGWYLEPKVNMNSRFFVMPGFRLDGGSNGTRSTANGANFSGFPKVNASWVLSEEPRFPLKSLFSVLRLRGAYGQAGVQPTPQQRFRLVTEGTGTLLDGTGSIPIITNATIGNTKLRPERSTEFERGVDAGLWDGRANIGVTYSSKTRRDAILDVQLPLSLGYGTAATYSKNIGVIRSRSFELTTDAQLVRSQVFGWNINANISKLTNMVVSLNPGEKPTINEVAFGTPSVSIVPGFPLFGVWARPILGYADADGNGRLSESEVAIGDTAVYLGPSEPKYQLNLSNTIDLFSGRVSINGALSYADGMTQVRGVSTVPSPGSSFAEQAAYVAITKLSRGTSYGYIQQVNTLRFSTLSIAYVMPASFARRLFANSMNVALQGSNLGLHTNYRGKDPNVNGAPYGNSVVDTGQLPAPRTWSIRIALVN